jgi:carbon storage regulator CsrA
MLILTRRVGETLTIGDEVTVTVECAAEMLRTTDR